MESKKLNFVFLGNFAFPNGMASTKRIRNFIDYLNEIEVNSNVIILKSRTNKILKNQYKGKYGKFSTYFYLGQCFNGNLIISLFRYFKKGFSILLEEFSTNMKNILYVYGPPSLDNILFILFAKFKRYTVVFDIVENNSVVNEKLSFKMQIKYLTMGILDWFLCYLASGIVVISTKLNKKYSTRCPKLPIILYPITINRYNKIDKLGFNKPIKLFYSGTFGNKEGLEYLFLAFEDLLKIGIDIQLLMTGIPRDIEITEKFKADKITFLGYLNDENYYELINNVDILCMTRNSSQFAGYGFPFKLGEFLATGNPVIATNVSDISLYLVNKRHAYIIRPDHEEDIITTIKEIISNPKKALKIGIQGKERAKELFDATLNSYNLYKSLINLK